MLLASAGDDRTIRLWDVATSYQMQTLEGHEGAVLSVGFSPDSVWIASGSTDRTVRLWNGPSGTPVAAFFDPAATDRGEKAVSFHYTSEHGQTITQTLPCGSPIPPGAVCTCNCVPGTYSAPPPPPPVTAPSGPSGIICTCDQICTCVPIV